MSAATTHLGVDHPTVVPRKRQRNQSKDGVRDEDAGDEASA